MLRIGDYEPGPYAGIGSRQTPLPVMDLMTEMARLLDARGFTLRSGGAIGADTAFERGATKKEIYLAEQAISPEAFALAEIYHPAWHRCDQWARRLHARNCYQVLGRDLRTPARFVLCWTQGGTGRGGTGQAIRIARAHGVPVFDMGRMH